MASELRVNTINSRTGFGTITVSETGQDLVGITTIENLTAENTLVGAAASFTGNVSVGGVLTYEDVTNIDSVGLITARQGIEIGARPGVAASISVDGNMIVSGVSTFAAITATSFGAVSGTTGTFSGDVSIADKIIHTGDTNTAIRFADADTITAETGGSERLRITSGGQVLIGNTADPSDYNSGADDLIIGSHSSASGATILSPTNNSGFIMFSDNNGGGTNAYRGQIEYYHGDDYMRIMTASAERFRIDSNGNTNITGITTATHFIPTAQPYGTKNLVINGSMQVAQRGTSSTTNGYGSLDRWNVTMGNTDEAFTHSQIELTSSDTGPWAEGFHNAMRIQNGNQTSSWQANSHGVLHQFIEDRDIAQSGWQIESPSSYITVSYWIRSSVAQAFGGHVETYDGTDKTWIWSTGTLSANTWTKITKTIGGSSGLSMSNDNGRGLQIQPWFIWGTDYTSSDATLNGWASYNGSKRFTDMTSTWWTTNDATVDITGVQIEVGKAATPFEHISYADQLQRCKRYYNAFGIPGSGTGTGAGYMLLSGGYAKFGGATSLAFNRVFYDVEMRASPTIKYGRNTANDDMVIMRWSDLGSNPTLTVNSSEGNNSMGFHPTLYNSTGGQTYDEGKWFIHSVNKFRADAEL